ncbi:MAG TPA: sulfotransferase [Tepidisphaeraceae bacterium]|jgi:sulfotransferase|nr:sulfotransferase [Tepidisphaeraceae bacterium]
MPRSGSTLLQNIMGQNPDFYVTPTSGLLELVYAARMIRTTADEFKAQDEALMTKAFLAFSKGGMESYFRALTDKPYVLDKSRGWSVHFDLLTLIWGQEPKIICMVRDLRQILSSMEKQFRRTPAKNRPIENHGTGTGTTTIKRALINVQSPPVGIALDRIAEVHQRGWNKKMLFLRYEDFAVQPAEAMKSVYAFLGLPEFNHDFNNVVQVTQEDDQIHGSLGMHDIRPKVQPLPNDYLAILGRETVRYIETNYAWYFSLFNYPTDSRAG